MLATSEEMLADNETGEYEVLCKWKALVTFSRFWLYQTGISEEQQKSPAPAELSASECYSLAEAGSEWVMLSHSKAQQHRNV